MALPSAWTDHKERGTTRARSKLACSASSRETAAQWRAHACHANTREPADFGGRSWHVAPRPRAEEERPLADAESVRGA